MKSVAIIMMLLLWLCAVSGSCQPSKESLAIEIPAGFVAVTNEQKMFVENIKKLSPGMSQAEVRKSLGQPSSESANLLFYKLPEDASGGYFIIVRLVFNKNGLLAARLEYGHMTIEQRNEN